VTPAGTPGSTAPARRPAYCRRTAEGGLELVIDRGRKGIETDHRIQAVFRQQVQRHQQRAAADGQLQLR
jgi:hypothetical protein